MTLGESARAHRAATTGVSSLESCRSTSTPGDAASPPLTVSPARSSTTSAPIMSSRSRTKSPPWVVYCGQPGHVHPAAGDQRGGEELGRVGQVGLDLHVEGVDLARLDPPGVHLAVVDDDARVAQRLDGHLDVRQARHAPCRRGAR